MNRSWNIWLNPGVKVFATNEEWIARARQKIQRFTVEDTFRVRTHSSVPHDQMIVTLNRGTDRKPWVAVSVS